MRLPDFTFPGNAPPAALSREAELNQYIAKVSEENFIKAGVSGEGEPTWLPAILDGIEVGGSLLVDDVKTQGRSGNIKVISGWSDSDLSITLLLIDVPRYTADSYTPDVTRFDCLKQIVQRFKSQKNGAPCVYTLQHPHIAAWGLKEFIFNDLKSVESRGKRIITCTLGFDEFDSVSGKSQDRQLASSISIEAQAQSTSINPIVPDKTRRRLERMEARLGR